MSQQYNAHQYQLLARQQEVIEQANRQMEKIGMTLLDGRQAKDIHEAVRMACEIYGKEMALSLQNSLRFLGARDAIVTCP